MSKTFADQPAIIPTERGLQHEMSKTFADQPAIIPTERGLVNSSPYATTKCIPYCMHNCH